MRSRLDRPDVRLQFSGHETFPCRYGWLKKAYDAHSGPPELRARAFSPDTAIADFGIGKNMVASMRHWSLACGILEPSSDPKLKGEQAPTALGRLILGRADPYLEHPGSVWALHWRLASVPGRATAWYYAFNEFNESVFTRDQLVTRLSARVEELREAGRLSGGRIARATVERDVDCFVRTYLSRTGGRMPAEDGLECPLAELGLVGALPGVGAFQFRRGAKPTLPDEVFAWSLLEYWKSQFATRGSLSLEAIAHEPGSPGRVFLLDEDSLAERLERISATTGGLLSWDESTGLRQVTARRPIAEIDPHSALEALYAFADAA